MTSATRGIRHATVGVVIKYALGIRHATVGVVIKNTLGTRAVVEAIAIRRVRGMHVVAAEDVAADDQVWDHVRVRA